MQLDKEYIQNLIEEKIKNGEKKYGKEFKNLLIEIIGLEKMLNPETKEGNEPKKSRLIPLARWNDYHDYPTVSALRQYKFHKDINGFDEVLEPGGENGNRILINEDKYFIWQKNRSKFHSK